MLDVILTLTICIPFCFLLLISPFFPLPRPYALCVQLYPVTLFVPLPPWEKGSHQLTDCWSFLAAGEPMVLSVLAFEGKVFS